MFLLYSYLLKYPKIPQIGSVLKHGQDKERVKIKSTDGKTDDLLADNGFVITGAEIPEMILGDKDDGGTDE